MLVTRANDGVTVLVRPVPPRCVNTYIDEPPATSPMQQLVTTLPRPGDDSNALTTVLSISLVSSRPRIAHTPIPLADLFPRPKVLILCTNVSETTHEL